MSEEHWFELEIKDEKKRYDKFDEWMKKHYNRNSKILFT